MPKYICRLTLAYDFATEHLKEQGSFWDEFYAQIPPACEVEHVIYHFSYSVIKLKGENQDAVKNLLIDAWEKKLPGKALAKLHITLDDGTERSELMRVIYSAYIGVEAYLELVTEMTDVVPLLLTHKADKTIRMRSYLFAIDSGRGYTTLLSSFGDYLHRMHVYPEEEYENRVRYIELTLGGETAGEKICVNDCIQRFLDEQAEEAIVDNIVGLDISYFLDESKHIELRNFIHRLYPFQDDYIFVFRLPFLEKKSLDVITGILTDMMSVKVLDFPPLPDCLLFESMWKQFHSLGYNADISLREPFFERIQMEKKDGRFYGFKSVEKIVHEMIWEKTQHDADIMKQGETPDVLAVTAADLKENIGRKEEKTGYEALAEMIGMETIEKRIREITAQVKLALADNRLEKPCIHMRFTGAPGTGKTTVARIVGQIFREEGILRKGALMEYSARALCGEYIGQTAVKTAAICRDAYGSVLFIDEAYALYEDHQRSNDYGKEALTTLISEMENHRDDMLVIMAGYTDEMDTLMQGNTGLRSRMPYVLEFPHYTREQLLLIFMQMVKKHFDYTPELYGAASEFFLSLTEEYLSSREFANGRFVRNLYERTWSKAALRTSLAGKKTIVLGREDFISASTEKEFSEKLMKKKHLGF